MSETVIDITRNHYYIAWCPGCGLERELPPGWRRIMRESMPPQEAREWDGILRCARCKYGSDGAMVIIEFRAHLEVEGTRERLPDGIVIHLARDGDRERTACSGEPYQPPPYGFRPRTPRVFCYDCHLLMIRGEVPTPVSPHPGD
jgi:hypothetical protein